MSSVRQTAFRVALLIGVGALAASCGGVESLSFQTPPTTRAASAVSPSTLPGDLNLVQQPVVPGITTTTLPPIGPGKASITGSVFGPGGPVPGATIEADRLVGNQVATATATTAADGSFAIGNILGGRYRVRAWHGPNLAMTSPQIFFLDAGQPHGITLQLTAFNGPDIATSANPGVLQVGQIANLLVQVTNPTVGNDGVVRDQPLVGAPVSLTNGPEWTVYNGNPQTTGTNGRVIFQISCAQAGDNPLSVSVGSGSPQPVATPACVQPAPPTTTCNTTTTSPGHTSNASTTEPQSGC
ncbi:MAG TPA: carboxypeptidase-like regulatory domain-containing protein [Acidimicrobiales bacterium]|nr:carboxypeptidase-like regulatory domain-containing protein [Acidimicrobiales bacterium]